MLEMSLIISHIIHIIVKREISFVRESNSQISFLISRGGEGGGNMWSEWKSHVLFVKMGN